MPSPFERCFRGLQDPARIEDVLRIEGALHRCHQRQFRGLAGHREVGPLDPADAVLGRHRTAETLREVVDEMLDGPFGLAYASECNQAKCPVLLDFDWCVDLL